MKKASCLIFALLPLTVATLSWAFDFNDSCVEASKLVTGSYKSADNAKQSDIEARIQKICPDGPAGLFVKGLDQERKGKVDEATVQYRKALKLDPLLVEARGNLGLLYLKKGLFDDAAIELTKALAADDNPRYHEGLGTIFNEKKFYQLALYHYGEALKAFPESPGVYASIADTYANMGQIGDAEKAYKKALSFKPGDEHATVGFASCLLSANEPESAIKVLTKSLALDSKNQEMHRILAEAYEMKGDSAAASREYQIAGKDRPLQPQDHVRIGDDFFRNKEFEKAIQSFQAALKAKPDWPEVQQKLGDSLMAVKRDDEAIVQYEDSIRRLKGENGEIHYNVGTIYERKGLLDEAIVEYKQAVQLNNHPLDSRRRMAEIYSQRGSYPQAVEQYRALLVLEPSTPMFHFRLAMLLLSMKNVKDATGEFLETVRLDPDNLEAHRNLATIYNKNGQTDEAEKQYLEVLRLKKDEMEARNALLSIYVKQKKYDDITKLLQEGTTLNPTDPNSFYKLGLIYEYRKQYDAAAEQYKKAIEMKVDHAKALNALGRVYMKTGRFTEAKEALEAAEKADPKLVETTVLLNNIKEELSPHKSKYKKSRGSKRAKSKKKSAVAGKKQGKNKKVSQH